jgi:UDP-glucuronate 4-epimerase
MKKIQIVTGAAGFVGFSVSLSLLKKGNNIIGIDNVNNYYDTLIKKKRISILKKYKNFKFFKIDLIDLNKLKYNLNSYNIEKVFHFAAQAGVRHSINHPEEYVSNNLVATFNILEFCRKKKIGRLIFASSSSVYGKTNSKKIKENNNTDRPLQFYAATKKSCELMAHSYSSMYKIKTTVLRFFTLYGPWGRPDMALFKFTKSILENKYIEVYNNGKHKRDFTYIDDAVDAIIKTGNEKLSQKENFKIYNIGNGRPIKLMHYISLIENKLKIKAKIKYFPMQKGDVVGILSDNTKIKKLKTFNQSKINVETGVNRFIDWFRAYHKI